MSKIIKVRCTRTHHAEVFIRVVNGCQNDAESYAARYVKAHPELIEWEEGVTYYAPGDQMEEGECVAEMDMAAVFEANREKYRGNR